jgi:DNA-binding IclR family transcriptional regulator
MRFMGEIRTARRPAREPARRADEASPGRAAPPRRAAAATPGAPDQDAPDPQGEPRGAEDRYLVPGLARGLAVLQAFGPERRRMTLSDMAAAIGVTRSAAFRLVYTLDRLGFLSHDARSRSYALGPQVLRLGYGWLSARDLPEIAAPVLEALRDRTGWSAHLGVLEERDVVYLVRAASRRGLASVVQVGTRLPAHATAMGRVLLAGLPEAALRALYAGAALERFGPQTATSLPQLLARLREDRAAGSVLHLGGFEAGIAAVAAPVHDVTGRVIAAVNLSGPALPGVEDALRGRLREALLGAAAEISQALGAEPRAASRTSPA